MNGDVKAYVRLLLCVVWCVCKSPVCVDTDTRRHQVEFVLVPFCRISLFFFICILFVRARGILALSITKRCKSLSLSLSLSVFCRRSAVTGRADCWRRAVWALFSTRLHTHTHTCSPTRCCHTTYQHTMYAHA